VDELQRDLPPETAAAIVDEISTQARQTFDKVVETDWRLTHHNFLVNAGGAVAVLAYLGSSPTPLFAVWPLCCFLVGVAASGIEIRALLRVFSLLHLDALRRRAGFVDNKLRVNELSPANVGGLASPINHWCGWLAQISFVLGVVSGITLFVANAR
jgi:hypothetical protein